MTGLDRDGTDILYTYNADGLRTSKTINGIKFSYFWNGSKLTAQTWLGNTIYFYYDNNGVPIGFDYNYNHYYYVTNLQGDIIAILSSDGDLVAEYSYDAWGNYTIVTNKDSIANINPLRYRGYYFDSDIGLYYLWSRYYDSNTGRFISADSAEMIVKGEINLFSYCGNNPVIRSDNNGMFWKELWNGVKKVVRKVVQSADSFLRAKGFDTAAISASILQMYKDKKGVYHATFDCWQQYFGYNDFYDFIFDLFTNMKRKKFPFTYRREQYILWAWKGDYISLGCLLYTSDAADDV